MVQSEKWFRCKHFEVIQMAEVMKVGTDAMLLGAWAGKKSNGIKRILDIGTGTGILALMLSQRHPLAHVTGIDISKDSYSLARTNFENSPFAHNLLAVFVSLEQFARTQPEPFDLIVSNPPFYTGAVFDSPEHRQTMRHTVKLSHQELLKNTRDLMADQGQCCFILPFMEGLRFIELANQYGLFLEEKVEVKSYTRSTIVRLLLCFSRLRPKTLRESVITIYQGKAPEQQYSKEYRMLTQDFYLDT